MSISIQGCKIYKIYKMGKELDLLKIEEIIYFVF